MLISFLTPTYNRGCILGQLYKSLRKQKSKDFEWIIIDDGSTDQTETLVMGWKEEADFPIRYHKQCNGGKHRALNKGIPLAQAPFICIVDSDDYLVDGAMELIYSWITDIEDWDKYAGVSGTRMTPQGDIIGEYPNERTYVDATALMRKQEHLEGDKAEIYRTEILKKYPFLEFEGERFLSECAVWDRIGIDGFLIRWYPQPLYVCEYRDDGLTKFKEGNGRNVCMNL